MPPAHPSPRRRWLRVSLRGLMVLVLVAGGVVGWLVHTVRTQRAGVAAVKRAGGFVRYDYEFFLNSQGLKQYTPATEPGAPRWLRRWLGDELFRSVRQVSLFDLKSTATLAAVSRFDRLELLFISDTSGDEVAFGDLRRLRHLRNLSISGSGVTDAKLAAIGQIASLQSLELSQTRATDAGYAQLAGLRNLTHLSLFGMANLTDARLARVVAEMPQLQNLDLPGFGPPLPATIRSLAWSRAPLKVFQLGSASVTDADLAALGQLTQLEALELHGAGVTDAGLAHLGGLLKLRNLTLQKVPITDAGLAQLARLVALEQLDLDCAQVTDAGLLTLTHFPALIRLSMLGAQVTDAGLPTLARITSLKSLDLGGNCGITDAGMIPAQFGPGLEVLGLDGTKVTRAGCRRLVAAHRRHLLILPDESELPPAPSETP